LRKATFGNIKRLGVSRQLEVNKSMGRFLKIEKYDKKIIK
jgi:hypothetical protein